MTLDHATIILKDLRERYPWHRDYTVALRQDPKYGWTVTLKDEVGIGFATILVGTESEVAWTTQAVKGWR